MVTTHDQRLCLFTPVSVCLSVCVSVCKCVCVLTGFLKTIDQMFVKFYGMVGSKVKVARGQRVKTHFCERIIPFKIVAERRDKTKKNVAYSIL